MSQRAPSVEVILNPQLRMAVLGGVEETVRLHIERGEPVDARDRHGMTALMLAAAKNKPVVCSILLAAGADPTLVDPSGRSPLTLAHAAGAIDVVAVLEIRSATVDQDYKASLEPVVIAISDAFACDGWEPEHDGPSPDHDRTIAARAHQVQSEIGAHAPVDRSEDWSDWDVFLPEQAAPLWRPDDDEQLAGLRRLLRAAIVEGSVPEHEVVRLVSLATTTKRRAAWPEPKERIRSRNWDVSVAGQVAMSLPESADELEDRGLVALKRVLGELGVEYDERTGPLPRCYVEPDLDAVEEAVSEAVARLSDLGSDRQSIGGVGTDVSTAPLLSAEEETRLGREMELGLVSAFDALELWPFGMGRLHAMAKRFHPGRGATDLEAADDPEHSSEALEDLKVDAPEAAEEEDSDEAIEAVTASGLADRLGTARGLGAVGPAPISTLLVQLAQATRDDGTDSATKFRKAVAQYTSARTRMIVSNLRLAASIARHYDGHRLEVHDLIQEANIGLIKAVERFDWRRGFRFSTYGSWWIRQSVGRAVADSGRTIRVPVHRNEVIRRIEREAKSLEKQSGRLGSAAELAERLSIPEALVSLLLPRMEEPASLYESAGSGQAPCDWLIDDVSPDPWVATVEAALSAVLRRFVAELPKREAAVITLRFGLETKAPMTLEEVGRKFGYTRERMRQVEVSALTKLAHSSRTAILGDFLANRATEDASRESQSRVGIPALNSSTHDRAGGDRSQRSGTSEPIPAHDRATQRLVARAVTAGAVVTDNRATGGRFVVRTPPVVSTRWRVLTKALMSAGFRRSARHEYSK